MTTLLAETDPTALPDADAGTIVPQPGRPNYFWAKGHEWVYELHRHPVTGQIACECPGNRRHHHCYHADALRLYRWRCRVCPICEGLGWMHARPDSECRYVKRDGTRNPGPWPLSCCNGTGLRTEYEKHPAGYVAGEFAGVYCPKPVQPRPEAKR